MSTGISSQPGTHFAVPPCAMFHLHCTFSNVNGRKSSIGIPLPIPSYFPLPGYHSEHDNQVQTTHLGLHPADRANHPSVLLLFTDCDCFRRIHPHDRSRGCLNQPGPHDGSLQRSDDPSTGRGVCTADGSTSQDTLFLHLTWSNVFGDRDFDDHSDWISLQGRNVSSEILHLRKYFLVFGPC